MSVIEDSCFFLYGTLKPGQFAHYKIVEFVDSTRTVDAELSGYYLLIRDSLPFAYSSELRQPVDDALSPIKGSLVFPKDGNHEKLISRIHDHEDHNLYKRSRCTVTTPDGKEVEAFFYGALKAINRRGVEIPTGEWTLTDDPILGYGLPRLLNEINKFELKFMTRSFPADMHDEYWPLMWTIQGFYTNLMTVTECFCRLNFGSASKSQYYKEMDRLWASNKHLASISLPKVHVHNARDATDTERYSTEIRPFSTYYQVRNNMVHSGKEGFLDLEIIKNATSGLAVALQEIIIALVPEFEDIWKLARK